MKRSLVLVALVLLIAVGGIFLFKPRSGDSEVRFATVDSDWFNAPYTLALASKAKYRDAPKLDSASGVAAKTAVLAGDADIGLAALPPLLRDPAAIDQLVILACYLRSDQVVGLATRQVDKPLDGEIGIVEGSISQIYLAEYATKSQREFGSLATLGIRPPDGPSVLENEAVVTAALWEPHLSRADRVEGVEVLRPEGIYEISVCAIADREFANSNRTQVAEFIDALSEAGDRLRDQPGEARAELAEFIVAPELLTDEVWGYADFSIVTDSEVIAARLQTEMETLIDVGLLEGEVDYLLLIGSASGAE